MLYSSRENKFTSRVTQTRRGILERTDWDWQLDWRSWMFLWEGCRDGEKSVCPAQLCHLYSVGLDFSFHCVSESSPKFLVFSRQGCVGVFLFGFGFDFGLVFFVCLKAVPPLLCFGFSTFKCISYSSVSSYWYNFAPFCFWAYYLLEYWFLLWLGQRAT